jgi:hypothetical protein
VTAKSKGTRVFNTCTQFLTEFFQFITDYNNLSPEDVLHFTTTPEASLPRQAEVNRLINYLKLLYVLLKNISLTVAGEGLQNLAYARRS